MQQNIATKTQGIRPVDEQVSNVVGEKTADIDPKNLSKTLLAAKALDVATGFFQEKASGVWSAVDQNVVDDYRTAAESTVKDWVSSVSGTWNGLTGSSSDSRPVVESASNAGLTFNGIAIGQNEQLADIKVGEDVQFGGQMYDLIQ
jgi:hypothetical protein